MVALPKDSKYARSLQNTSRTVQLRCQTYRQSCLPYPAPHRPLTNLRSPQNEVITVVVGKGKHKENFPVYKKFICYYSPYFALAFDKLDDDLFMEDENQTGISWSQN